MGLCAPNLSALGEGEGKSNPSQEPQFPVQRQAPPSHHLGYKCHVAQGQKGLSGCLPSAKDSAELLGSVMPSHEMSR